MNWDAIGAVGEILGATAVLATLIYLAGQIRQTNTALRSQSRRQLLEGLTHDVERVLSNDALFDLYMKGTKGEALDEREEAQATALWLSFLGNLEIQFHEIRDGSLDRTFESTLRFRLSTILGGPGRERWERSRNYLSVEFQSYIDEQLASGLISEFADATYWTTKEKDA